jgi:hypothetical protein
MSYCMEYETTKRWRTCGEIGVFLVLVGGLGLLMLLLPSLSSFRHVGAAMLGDITFVCL